MSKITRRGFFQQAGAFTTTGATLPGLLSTSLHAEPEASWITRPDWIDLRKRYLFENTPRRLLDWPQSFLDLA